MKIKETEKNQKYLDLTKELRKLWNVRVTVIPFVTGSLRDLERRPEVLEIGR